MTRQFFNKQFAALVTAYVVAAKLTDEAQDVYWEMLKDMPEKDFAKAIKQVIATCKFFPTIAEIGEAVFPTIKRRVMLPMPPYSPWGRHADYIPRYATRVIGWKEQLDECRGRITPSAKWLLEYHSDTEGDE